MTKEGTRIALFRSYMCAFFFTVLVLPPLMFFTSSSPQSGAGSIMPSVPPLSIRGAVERVLGIAPFQVDARVTPLPSGIQNQVVVSGFRIIHNCSLSS